MKHHTVTSYQKELNKLQDYIIKMGNLLVDMLETQTKAMSNYGDSFVEPSKKIDKEINICDDNIEELAIIVLATRQPLAIDLRFVLSSIKLAVIMERMGDLSKNVIRRSALIARDITIEYDQDIKSMNQVLINMMKGVTRCFSKKELCPTSLIKEDEQIDHIYSSLMDKISQLNIERKKPMSDSIQIVMACKNIERIGDYITKLAKILHYIHTGKKLS